MKTSETIEQISSAFVKAQADLSGIRKDGKNPFFSSKYITLDAILEYVRPILTANGIALIQTNESYGVTEYAEINRLTVSSRLLHKSGEWIENSVTLPVIARIDRSGKELPLDAQSLGSALTYARRYGLTALLGINAETDDDGNSASRTERFANKPAPAPKPVAEPAQLSAVDAFRAEVIRLYGEAIGKDKNQQKLVWSIATEKMGLSADITPENMTAVTNQLRTFVERPQWLPLPGGKG